MGFFDLFKGEKFDYTVYINGMHCNHCAQSVENALGSLGKAKVDLDKKCAIVYSKKELNEETIKQAVEKTGFEFVSVTTEK